MKKLVLISLLLLISTTFVLGQTVANGENVSIDNPVNGSAIGFETRSGGSYSFAAGYQSRAAANGSFAFGRNVTAENQFSFALGNAVATNADYAWIIGSGFSGMSGIEGITNSIANSLFIGFNTKSTPSLFVEPFGSNGLSDGYVGIHTNTPTSHLDVNGVTTTNSLIIDGNERPFIMTFGASEKYVLTSDANGVGSWQPIIGSGGGEDCPWDSNGNHIYYANSIGNVGIGPSSSNPQERLHVFGNLRINGYMKGGESSGALKIQSNYGYTIIGAKNTSASHFETDRGKFEFNKKLLVNGSVEMDDARIDNDIWFLSGNDHLINFGEGTSQIRYGINDPGINSFEIYSMLSEKAAMHFNNVGQIAINHTNPSADLDVNGETKTNDLTVNQDANVLGNGQVDGTFTMNSENANFYYGKIGFPATFSLIKKAGSSAGKSVEDVVILKINDENHIGINNENPHAELDVVGQVKSTDLDVANKANIADLDVSGQLRISTIETASEYTLAVGGTIGCEKIEVKLQSNWPDYVFDEGYQLPELEEIENFVKENKHLPGVPSAEEVKENGQDLGEMNAILLQKIEELTLFMIEQQKEIDALKKQVNQ